MSNRAIVRFLGLECEGGSWSAGDELADSMVHHCVGIVRMEVWFGRLTEQLSIGQ
jgi:hypothetical protein